MFRTTEQREAIKLAINAGIDMSMDPYDWKFCTLLKELVEEGEVPMSRIDDAVRRVLRLKYRLNLFEKPYYDLKTSRCSVVRNMSIPALMASLMASFLSLAMWSRL